MSQFIEMFGDKEFSIKKWSEVLTITNGKAYKEEYQENGIYPIYGSGGIMGYGDKKLCNGDTVILGRKGNINSPIYVKTDYWVVDTAFCLEVDKDVLDTRFFHYWCTQFNFLKFNKQAVLPSLTKSDLLTIEISIPSMDQQKLFVDIIEQADKSKFVGFKSQFIEMFGDINDNSNGIPFDEIFYDDTKSATKISASEYLSSGQYAIYDQSQDTQICGYSNDDDGVNMDYPVILFGDHSRVVKLIDRPFYIGADGVKIIRSKQFDLNVVFAYYMIKYCNIPETGYNRHFKYLKLKRFFAPDREKQNQFVAIAQQADKSKYFS